MMSWINFSLLLVLLLAVMTGRQVSAQADVEDTASPPDLPFEPPTEFNMWCDQMNARYGDTCECTTERGTSNNIKALDLDHTIVCDPLPGDNMTCVEGVTVESAIVELTATSVGEEGNYTHVNASQILEFFIQLETSIGTSSFRYTNANFGQRTNGCTTVWGAYNCARCGICEMPERGVQVSPDDIFNGISGDCRFGQSPIKIGTYNVCDNGPNQMTRTLFDDLAVFDDEEFGSCEGYNPVTLPPTPDPERSSAMCAAKNLVPAATVASLAAFLAH